MTESRSPTAVGRPLRVVVAPDSYKGSCTAAAAAEAISAGVRDALASAGRHGEITRLPYADGGEGSLTRSPPSGISRSNRSRRPTRSDDRRRGESGSRPTGGSPSSKPPKRMGFRPSAMCRSVPWKRPRAVSASSSKPRWSVERGRSSCSRADPPRPTQEQDSSQRWEPASSRQTVPNCPTAAARSETSMTSISRASAFPPGPDSGSRATSTIRLRGARRRARVRPAEGRDGGCRAAAGSRADGLR